MKKTICRMLIIIIAISLLMNTAFATTVDGLLSEIKAQNPKMVTIANAESFFGEYVATNEVDLKDLVTGTYYAYIPVEASSITEYQASMEDLGFITSITEREDGVKQIIFDKDNARIVLIYSPNDSQLILCYQKDINFEPENATKTDLVDPLIGPEKVDITQSPTVTPAPTEQPEVGYVDVEIDGVKYHFKQVATSKSTDAFGDDRWNFQFYSYSIRNEKQAELQIDTNSNLLPGDVSNTDVDTMELSFPWYISFYDRDNTFFSTLNSSSEIGIDNMSNDGYEYTGHFSGVGMYDDVFGNKKTVTFKNGTFKAKLYEGDEKEHWWIDKKDD